MKKIIISVIALAAALATGAWAANFTPGNIVVYRVGDGSTNALVSSGSPVFLDEINIADGSTVQSVSIPTNSYFGANAPLIASGTAVSEGLMTRSIDGRFLVFTGFATSIGAGSSSLATLQATTVPRVIGTIDQSGHLNTSTILTNSLSNAEDIRTAVSTDGTNLWLSGDSSGLRYTTRGSTLAAQLSSFVTNLRQVNIYSNTLYFSDASGTAIRIGTAVTNGIPNTSTNALPTLAGTGFQASLSNFPAGTGSPYAFALFQLPGGTNTLNTLYVADDGGNGGIYKYSLMNNGTWVSNGVVLFTNARYLVGTNDSSGNVQLYAAGSPPAGAAPYFGGGNLVSYTDTTGFNQPPTGNGDIGGIGGYVNWAISPPSNAGFHGIALAPVGSETFPAGAGQISVGPITGFTSSGLSGGSFAATKTYNIANPGTNTVTWAASASAGWVSLSASSGTLIGGASANVVISFAAGPAAALSAGTNTASVTFTNNTAGNTGFDATSRAVTLIISDQTLTPSTDYTISGVPGGPFNPASKVYTLSNGVTPGTITYTVNKSANWLRLNGSVANSLTGTLSGGASAAITVAFDTNNANALVAGNYSDDITFSNATANTLIDDRIAALNAGAIYFCDDFSTFNQNTDLVGQQGWTQVGTISAAALQVIGGKVTIPAAVVADNQDAYKNVIFTTNHTIFAGMVLSVSNAPATAPSFFAALNVTTNGTTGSNFANYRFSAIATNSGFAFAARVTGQAQDPFTYGTNTLTYGTTYQVVIQTDIAGSNMTVYVNPTSGILGAQTPYMVHVIGAGAAPPLSVGDIVISQFGNGTTALQAGISISKVCVSTNYADVYNGTAIGGGPTDPFTAWQAQYFTGSPLSSAPGADPLGKGISNTNQFLAGFNPTNASAYVHITAVSKVNAGTDIRVDYLGASGNSSTTPPMASRTNVLEFTAGSGGNYNSNSFASTGQTNILSGGVGLGTLTNMVDPGGATNVPSRYYRVRVLVP
ncbi:MAG TPA: hypothetical protein VNL17_08265 [Verrucomicrobiae bacterium]|nr:hypothetical protein [Verrucomicrobiae bacterium]